MSRPRALAAARVPVVLALAACLLTLAAPAAGAATVTVHIRESLDPKTLTIVPGTAVRWVNESENRYRMRSRSGPVEFDSGNLEPTESFTFVFAVEGTYPYLDDRERDDTDFHGTIVVATGGSDGSADPTSTPGPGSTPIPAAPTSATVHMAGRSFSPSTLTIAAGGSVTFLNDDDREHTATAGGGAFDTGVLDPGARATKRFPTPGSFAFLCAIHPEMTGRVEVTGGGGGGGSGAAPAPTPTPRPTPRPTAEPPAPGATTSAASIVDFAFDPVALDVVAGSAIRWTNRGAAPHTVTAEDGSFDSGLIAAGASYERRFVVAGTFAFVCAFHPEMRGTIRVAAAGSPGSAGAAGGGPTPVAATPAPSPSGASSGQPSPVPVLAGVGVASPPDTSPTAATGEGAARLTLTVALVVVAIGVFGWLIRGTMRPAASRSTGR